METGRVHSASFRLRADIFHGCWLVVRRHIRRPCRACLKAILNKDEKPLELCGFKNVIIGAMATSVDALAVGISLSMSQPEPRYLISSVVSVFVITILSVIAGMFSGQALGKRLGRIAEIVGGLVLIGIGISILI